MEFSILEPLAEVKLLTTDDDNIDLDPIWQSQDKHIIPNDLSLEAECSGSAA
jgi:hypothetical protein